MKFEALLNALRAGPGAAPSTLETEAALAKARSKGCHDKQFNPLIKPPPAPLGFPTTKAQAETLKFFDNLHREHNKRCQRCGHGRRQKTGMAASSQAKPGTEPDAIRESIAQAEPTVPQDGHEASARSAAGPGRD